MRSAADRTIPRMLTQILEVILTFRLVMSSLSIFIHLKELEFIHDLNFAHRVGKPFC